MKLKNKRERKYELKKWVATTKLTFYLLHLVLQFHAIILFTENIYHKVTEVLTVF
jgi:hypothetical protein